jgi:hypothetical protein
MSNKTLRRNAAGAHHLYFLNESGAPLIGTL